MLQELRTEYQEKFGKRPFHGWKEDKLKELLAKDVQEDKPELNPILEKARLENEELMRDEITPEPVYLDGKPFYVIDNKYVPYWEGKKIIMEKQIEKLKKDIEEINKLYLSN